MPPGVIIAGSGRGSAYAKHLIERRLRPVAALVDTNTAIHDALRRRFAEEYRSPETAVCASLEEALERFPPEAADAVFVVTPNNTHAELLERALAAGRHVLLEKPVAADAAGLDAIATAAAAHPDRVIQVGFVLRYSPFFRFIVDAVRAGELGRVNVVQVNEWLDFAHSGNAYRRGWRRLRALTGGFLNEKCSHDLDLLCLLKDHEAAPARVYSVADTGMFPRKDTPERCPDCADAACPFRYEAPPERLRFQLGEDARANERCVFRSDADVYSSQSVTLSFSDGAQGLLTLLPYSGRPGRTVTLHGTEGYLEGEMETGVLRQARYRISGAERHNITLDLTDDGHGGGDDFIVEEFLRCIATGTRPRASLYDGLRASALAFMADRSAATGEAVPVADELARLAALSGAGR